MPEVDGKVITPAEAASRGLCPECGCSFEGKSIAAHRADHFARLDLERAPALEARKRDRMLADMAAKQEAAASAKP